MAKPRVFVSSTYYDLKYVRERLERFLKSYNMDPILFEYDKVYYNPNITPSSSCYKEIDGCHLMILIIGGRYGSIDKGNEREMYENDYVSVTQNEYMTAVEKGMPIMVFIDRNVYSEYKTYINNKPNIPADFKFAYVDDVKVFEFINKVGSGVVKDFDRVEDIEHYFSHQISGMLCEYLMGLQSDKENKRIRAAVDEIKTVSSSMQNMINSIAEKVLGSQDGKYKQAIFDQKKSLDDFFLELLKQNIDWGTFDFDVPEDKLVELRDIFMSTILNVDKIKKIQDIAEPKLQWEECKSLCDVCEARLNAAYVGAKVRINFFQFRKQLFQIMNETASDKKLSNYMYDKLIDTIRDIIDVF